MPHLSITLGKPVPFPVSAIEINVSVVSRLVALETRTCTLVCSTNCRLRSLGSEPVFRAIDVFFPTSI